MSKETIDSKTLAVRVPTHIFEQFKERCDKDGFRMSELVRLFIRGFIQHGTYAFGATASDWEGYKSQEDK